LEGERDLGEGRLQSVSPLLSLALALIAGEAGLVEEFSSLPCSGFGFLVTETDLDEDLSS
jgi:hypothetical protein